MTRLHGANDGRRYALAQRREISAEPTAETGGPATRGVVWCRGARIDRTPNEKGCAMADIQFFPTTGGSFTVTSVSDNNGAPSHNLEAKSPFDVQGDLKIAAGDAITGKATVTIYVDQLGGHIDRPVGSATVAITGDGSYPWKVTVPGATLPDAPPVPPNPAAGSNLYRMAAVLTMENSAAKGTETTAFVEMGLYGIS